MRISIVTLGTQGDVQPYVALGLGLKGAGHEINLVTHDNFKTFITGRGLGFSALAIDPRAMLEDEQDHLWQNGVSSTLRSIANMARVAEPLAKQLVLDCWRACKTADVIMCSVTGSLIGYHIAEKLGVPFYPAYLQNVFRTRAYPSMLAPIMPLGSGYNWLSYNMVDHLVWRFIRPYTNQVRQEILGLAPLSSTFPLDYIWQQRQPHLLGFSSAVLPKPPEWGDWAHLTGYWFLDQSDGWQPPADLVDFLESGPAPISVGFGSLHIGDPEAATKLVVEALARTKQRGILLTGWGGLRQTHLPDNVFQIEAIPHDWLFPRVAAVIHHGGAGTTAAGLRAGVPNIVIPHFTDQPFWGQRVAQLGVGPRPIPRSALSSARLAAAIQVAVHDPAMRVRAVALGRKLQAEDGVARAVEIFQHNSAQPIAIQSRSPRLLTLRRALGTRSR
jgi:UDP:flavonoid glycosyltransferase YjiC (YdhE family)